MQTQNLRTKAGSALFYQSRTPLIHPRTSPCLYSFNLISTRAKSTSLYGRTHVWKRRLPVLPNPVVPKFPQKIIRSDGSSFVQWTTSPKSLVRLTRDTTNNPVWNTDSWASDRGLDDGMGTTGRMGRFSRKFGGVTVPKEEITQTEQQSQDETGEDTREDVLDLTGKMGMRSAGMGGVLDDFSWFEQMANMTGGEAKPGKAKKE